MRYNVQCPMCNIGPVVEHTEGLARCENCGHVFEPAKKEAASVAKAVEGNTIIETIERSKSGMMQHDILLRMAEERLKHEGKLDPHAKVDFIRAEIHYTTEGV